MGKFNNLYKDFFGLNEQTNSKIPKPEDIEQIKSTTAAVKDL
jgi:hypothetical protein